MEAWVADCAQELQRLWKTASPKLLAGVAADIAECRHLSRLAPAQAAQEWLRPLFPDALG